MTLRKREKKFQHPQIWAGRARGGQGKAGRRRPSPAAAAAGEEGPAGAARSPGTAGTAGRGPAEPKRSSPLRLRHARPGGGGAAVPPVRPAPGSNGGGPGRPPTSVPEEVF